MKKVMLDGMKHNNRFEDGQKVIHAYTGEELTVSRWSYAPNLGRYTYSVVEQPSTFFFENELLRMPEDIINAKEEGH